MKYYIYAKKWGLYNGAHNRPLREQFINDGRFGIKMEKENAEEIAKSLSNKFKEEIVAISEKDWWGF